MTHASSPESLEQQQRITQALRVGETPQEFAPPEGEAALVITHMPVPETEEDRMTAESQPLAGLELISKMKRVVASERHLPMKWSHFS